MTTHASASTSARRPAPLLPVLVGGLRLAILRAPRRTPLEAGVGTWLLLVLVGLALDAALHWPQVDAPRLPNSFGLQTGLAAALLRLASSAAICAITRRRALFWPVAGWIEAAMLPVGVVVGAVFALAPDGEFTLRWSAWLGGLAWVLLILLRLSAFLQPGRVAAALAAATLGLLIQAGPWQWLQPQRMWVTDWAALQGDGDEVYREPGELEDPETALYAQPTLLQQAIEGLAPQRDGHIDLFGLAFGGDASEDVFRNEVEFFQRLLPQRFDAADRVLALLNHPERADELPLASATALERTLLGLGQRMNRDEDILFLYLTTHGSAEHELYVNQPPLPFDQLTPERLRAALDAARIRWRVLVVSACYSGGFVEALRDPHTLVITAARADRTSFGCGADSKVTWFGKAYLAQALNDSVDFIAAFATARAQIEAWEKEGGIEASDPQIDVGAKIADQLERWRKGFTPGPVVPYMRPSSARGKRAAVMDAAPESAEPDAGGEADAGADAGESATIDTDAAPTSGAPALHTSNDATRDD